MEEPRSFTGVRRRRKTSWKVLAGDRIARALITLGGLGTIVAVSLVCVFLVWVAVPLFLAPSVAPSAARDFGGARPGVRPVATRVDEYRVLGWTLFEDGAVDLFRADTGAALHTVRPFGEVRPTAVAMAGSEGRCAFGFADGTVRLGRIRFATEFLERGEEFAALKPGEVAAHGGGLVERTGEGQLRVQRLAVDADPPVALGGGRPVVRIDLTLRSGEPRILACTDDGVLHLREVARTVNLLTNQETLTLSGGDFTGAVADGRGTPDWLLLSGIGTTAYAAWKDGTCLRLDTRRPEEIVLAERVDLRGGDGGTVASLGFLIGKTTLVAGLSGGRLRAWFPARPAGATTADGAVLVNGHVLGDAGPAVTALAASERTRFLAAGYADGAVRLWHVTSGRLIGEGSAAPDAVAAVTVAPKDDAVVALAGNRLLAWEVDAPHPETDFDSIFRPVWYEGAVAPEHVWQSSSGTDDFEPKFGLWPLVFGTLKATFYTMLFAVPLALLAAIYTSEYLSPSLRSKVKPTIELMASLPSVVLGFLAALIFAPVIETVVPAVLVAFATVPFTVLLGSYLWQLLPVTVVARLGAARIAVISATIPAGLLLAFLLGPVVERRLFAGDIKAWLDGGAGTGTGGWLLLLLPATAAAAVFLNARFVNPLVASAARGWTRGREAAVELVRFLLTSAAVLGAALLAAGTLSSLGFDPRGSCLDTYVQRNALVVGIVMGFAVIPIIYTLSEDAFASVPEHLRAASLAVGATRWQTAVGVILPTAMSGLFSAVMIGLGRAVGETMVVLMAAGNTPIMEWNAFNGFRTLSANIAVELPEAVQGGTNYRMLFLAALTLFAMTFVLNTVAETIRQRFRKRAYEL